MLRIDVNVPDGARDRLSGAERQPVRRAAAGCGTARDLGVRAAQSVALQLRRSGARRHRRAGHRRRRPGRMRRDRLRAARSAAAATTAGATAKARTTTSRRGRRRLLPLIDPIHEYDRDVGPVDHRRLRLSRPRARLGAHVGRYFFADFVAGRVWSFALDDRRQGEARASGLIGAHGRSRRPGGSATSARSASTPTASSTSSATRAA